MSGSGTKDTMTDEEYVRNRWKSPWMTTGQTGNFGVVLITASLAVWGDGSGFETEAAAWSSAAEFTRQREEEIRQLRREIKQVEHMVECLHWHRTFAQKQVEDEPGEPMSASDASGEYARDLVTWNRTLARLQRDLTALLNGWREQDGK